MNLYKLKRKILITYFLRFPYKYVRIWALKKCGFQIGNDVYIGDNLTLTVGFADRSMKLIIGDRAAIGSNSTLVIASHPNESRLKPILLPPKRIITIGNDTWIGVNVIILPGISIGECCIIGAGSVVTHDIPSFSIAVGNPARILKEVDKSKLNQSY